MNHEFESMYRAHVDAVYRYTLRLVGNRQLAEDITSEAFLELYRQRDSIEPGRLPAWLLTVARNRAVDYWRRTENERRYSETAREPATTTPAPDLQEWLAREPALKPVHRTCLILHFIHGLTRAEIAQRLSLSDTQVKGHLQYALQLLRKAWDGARTGGQLGLG
jgi:RNA polymerase sigma-70 factor (ECF subfamily)